LSTSSGLSTSGSTYRASSCNYLILISKTFSSPCTTCPAGESEIAGRECGALMCVCVCFLLHCCFASLSL
jgi:hypothetical protein